MSRGPGALERFIEAVAGEGQYPWSTTELANDYFDPPDRHYSEPDYMATPTQRSSVLRAMHSFVRKHPEFGLMGGKGRSNLYLYRKDDPLSEVWAKLRLANSEAARIRLENAEAELARIEAERAYEQAKANVGRANAEVEKAREQAERNLAELNEMRRKEIEQQMAAFKR